MGSEMCIRDSSMDYVTNNIILPLGGIFIAIFAGWVLSSKILDSEMTLDGWLYPIWKFLARFIAPAAVAIVFIMALLQV